MSTTFYTTIDNVSTTTTGYTAGAGSIVLEAGAGSSFGSTFPLLISTFLADGTPKGVYSVSGRTTDTLTGLTLVAGTDASLPDGSLVAIRWTAEHVAQYSTAVNTLEVTAAGLGTASTHSTGDFDAAGAAAAVNSTLSTHTGNTSNPHSVTKTQVGLGSVDNTSDASKPVSTATQTALDLKAPLASPTFTGTVRIDSDYGAITADSDGATITFNLATSNAHAVTLGGNRTLALSGDQVGQVFTVILKQDATGSRTVTWWSGILWPGGTAPTLTTTAAKRDVFTFLKSGSGEYLGFNGGQNY